MEVEEFIEQDILVFLDKRLEEGTKSDVSSQAMRVQSVYLSRDYEEELTAALQDDNIARAKKVLHDLKKKFDTIPPGTPDKQDVKILLAELYERFRKHVGGEKMPLPEKTPRPEPKEETEEEVKEEQEEPPVPEQNSMVAMEALAKLREAEKELEKGNPKEAVHAYREAKRAALSMDVVPADVTQRFKETFGHIKAQLKGQSPVPPVHPVQDDALDKDLLLQLEREKQHLDEQLHERDREGADETYKRMKTLAQQIHDHDRAENAAKKLIKIKSVLDKMEQVP